MTGGADGSVLLLTTGGTISMTPVAEGGVAPSLGSSALLASTSTTHPVVARDFKAVPGAHLTISDVIDLARAVSGAADAGHCGVVIVQGTDTIEEVAFGLDLLADRRITTVVTGAMRGAMAPGADGAANIADAVAVAADSSCRDLGVLVVLAGEVHSAALVRKAHTVSPHAFESHPGALGWVVEGRPSLSLRPTSSYPQLVLGDDREARLPTIGLLTACLGADDEPVRRYGEHPPDGLVVEGFGAGHVPPGWVDHLEAVARSCPVVLCSRTRRGPLLTETYAFAGSERDLLGRGILGAGALDAPKAVVALRLLVLAGADRDVTARFFLHHP
jgi:L-asparaginase